MGDIVQLAGSRDAGQQWRLRITHLTPQQINGVHVNEHGVTELKRPTSLRMNDVIVLEVNDVSVF